MDPLSDILSLLNAKSLLSASLQAGGSWAVRFSEYGGVKFNAVVRGACWLVVDGLEKPVWLEGGDCFLLTDGRPFVLASDLDLKPAVAHDIFAHVVDGMASCGDAHDFLAIGGRVMLEQTNASLLLEVLPPLIRVGGTSEPATVLRWILQRLSNELAMNQPGMALMTDHLAHIMFVQVLRAYLASEDRPTIGWLSALTDQRIAAAIRLIHANPARRWTLVEFADAACMSRSNFALRFKALVGIAPLDYLLRWRMRLAGHALRQGTGSVSSIATSLGYESESAFSNAFKRVTGCAPSHYRRNAGQQTEGTIAV